MNITAASCIFPSGPGIALAGIALDSQIALNRQHPFYVDRCGGAVRGSFFPQPPTFNVARWIALAQAALQDLQQQLAATQAAAEYPCHLWLVLPPANRAGVPADLANALVAAWQDTPFSFASIKLIHGGHAAPVLAIDQASQFLHQQPRHAAQAAIVLAVDSWLHPDALNWLEAEDLLHNAGKLYQGLARRNPYGRIPGEAAAAVMLSLSGPAWCRILGSGSAIEPIERNDHRPCIGLGWTRAAHQALSGLPPAQKVTHIISDLNGEPWRADQFGFTALRISARLRENWQRHTPALISADVGSASALLHVALSANLLRQPVHRTQTHLLLSSSDDSLRAALVLAA
jgi:3-oxoacyl-[acyl-carrier-protein] synthase I